MLGGRLCFWFILAEFYLFTVTILSWINICWTRTSDNHPLPLLIHGPCRYCMHLSILTHFLTKHASSLMLKAMSCMIGREGDSWNFNEDNVPDPPASKTRWSVRGKSYWLWGRSRHFPSPKPCPPCKMLLWPHMLLHTWLCPLAGIRSKRGFAIYSSTSLPIQQMYWYLA